MIRHFLPFICACLTATVAMAQSGSTRSFMVGPSIGIDQMSYVNSNRYVGGPSYMSPEGLNFGVDGSYQAHRLLVGLKVLYTNRVYQVIPSRTLIDIIYTPDPLLRTNTDLHVLTVPLSVSYQLTGSSRIQWFVGANVTMEKLLGTGEQTVISKLSTRVNPTPEKSIFGRPVNIGYGAQATLRYLITPVIGLQLEPALRIYPSGGFPSTINSNYQFQGQFAVLFKV